MLVSDRYEVPIQIRTTPCTPSGSIDALHEAVYYFMHVVTISVVRADMAVVGLVESHTDVPTVVHAEGCESATSIDGHPGLRSGFSPWSTLPLAEASFSLKMSAPSLMLSA